MAIQGVGQGFFSSNGELKINSVASTSNNSSQTSSDNLVSDQASSISISSIVDAAVVTISSRLNVAGTGFDSGVADLLNQALTAGQNTQEQTTDTSSSISTDNNSSTTDSLKVGGTYQNQILYNNKNS